MSLIDELGRLHAEGQLGHAYLCVGDPLAEGRHFAEELACVVLGEGDEGAEEARTRHRVEARLHPDVHWVEPRGKLRQIKVVDLQLALKRIHEKSFEGGWKIMVFLAAERLNPTSGNQLLKTLEEPPPRTLILLVSDAPEQILETLRSRCQTLHLPRHRGEASVWLADLLPLLRMGPPRNLRPRLERAALFRDFFEQAAKQQIDREDADAAEEEVDTEVENARMTDARRKMQRAVLSTVEDWYRDVMVCHQPDTVDQLLFPEEKEVLMQQAQSLPVKSLRKILENIRNTAHRFEGNLPVQVVLEQFVF